MTQQGVTIWLTGLSGAGKSTVSAILEERLRTAGRKVEVLDGDVVRLNLCSDLGFSRADRDTNIRRIGWVSAVLNRNGVDTIVAAISPYRDTRDEVRGKIPNFVEVYMECPLDILVERDVKGLYRKAIAGEISHFTGVSDPYEPPLSPEITCHSDGSEVPGSSADRIISYLSERGLIG